MDAGKKVIVMATAVFVAVTLLLGNVSAGKVHKGGDEPELVFRTDKYGTLTHYMHMIYEHYTVAGKLVKKGEIDNAIIHLKALKYYVDRIPGVIPDKDREGKKLNKKLYVNNFNQLKKFTENMLKELKAGTYSKGKPLPPPDVVTKTCDDCHKDAKIRPPW